MQLTTITAGLLAIAPALAIPPEDFGFPSAPNDTELGITFNPSGPMPVMVSEGELLGPEVPAQPPQVTVNRTAYSSIASYNGAYVVLMVDPDASTPQNPTSRFILHWMGANFTADMTTGVLSNSTAAVVDYARPMPPPTSDPHRYILYALQQPENFMVPEAFAGFSAMNRTKFNLTEFVTQANLGMPAAANYFFVQNKTGTPPDFTASAGSQYPGGNAGAITQGPGPMITPSSSMSGDMTGTMTSANAASETSAGNNAAGGSASAAGAAENMIPVLGAFAAAVGGMAFYAL